MNGPDVSFILPAHSLGLMRSGGVPLPGALRNKMEAAFGADFSQVRIHEGAQPGRLGALAFTSGKEIYFAPGCYRPETPPGQRLLGHELAHVLQQSQGRVTVPAGSGLYAVVDEALEREADEMGRQALRSRPPVGRRAPSGLRQPAGGRALQAFWVRQDNGTNLWLPVSEWNAGTYDYLTWTWPLCGWPRGVYQKTCLLKSKELDELYGSYRDNLNKKIGGGLDLDNPEAYPRTQPGVCIQALFDKFKKTGWFTYTMRLTTFLNANEGNCEGDCLALCVAFIYIAKHEFGINVQMRCQAKPFLTGGKATIDLDAIGNCDVGTNWFFQNHYWISYQGKTGPSQAYDLLFGTAGAPAINPKLVSSSFDSKKDLYTLANGTVVRDNGEKEGTIPGGHVRNRYSIVK
jgi:hypothetical protein